MKTITAKGLSAILLAALLLLLPGTGKEACAADPASDSADTMEPVDTTVMIYMCGSDLESRFGAASKDITEMIGSGFNPEHTHVLIMAGGSRHWITGFDTSVTSIIELGRRGMRPVWRSESLLNMAESGTLQTFLEYGMSNYPADRYGLILWDHGGGPNEGTCYDELFGGNSMNLRALEQALMKSVGINSLEWIGFDACLMSSVETAYELSTYAKYMIASQEEEPSTGWNYSFLNGLEYDSDGGETGRRIVDSFFEANEERTETLTLSCVDLKKSKAIGNALNEYFDGLYSALDTESFSELSRNRSAARGFGRAPYDETSDFDLVDLEALIRHNGDRAGSKKLIRAVEEAVVYSRSNVEEACGLSIYHPSINRAAYTAKWAEWYEACFSKMSASYVQYLRRFGQILTGKQLESWGNLIPERFVTESGEVGFRLQLTEGQVGHYEKGRLMVLNQFSPQSDSRNFVWQSEELMPDENGVLTAVCSETAVYVVDDKTGKILTGPIDYVMTDEGYLLISCLYADESGILDQDLLRVMYVCSQPDQDGQVRILAMQVYNDMTGAYTSRAEFDEEYLASRNYDKVYFQYNGRVPAHVGEELPGYWEWNEDHLFYALTIRTIHSWHLEMRQFADRETTFAAFQITDTQGRTHSSELIRIHPETVQNYAAIPDREKMRDGSLTMKCLGAELYEKAENLTIRIKVQDSERELYGYDANNLVLNGNRILKGVSASAWEGDDLLINIPLYRVYGIKELYSLEFDMSLILSNYDHYGEEYIRLTFPEPIPMKYGRMEPIATASTEDGLEWEFHNMWRSSGDGIRICYGIKNTGNRALKITLKSIIPEEYIAEALNPFYDQEIPPGCQVLCYSDLWGELTDLDKASQAITTLYEPLAALGKQSIQHLRINYTVTDAGLSSELYPTSRTECTADLTGDNAFPFKPTSGREDERLGLPIDFSDSIPTVLEKAVLYRDRENGNRYVSIGIWLQNLTGRDVKLFFRNGTVNGQASETSTTDTLGMGENFWEDGWLFQYVHILVPEGETPQTVTCDLYDDEELLGTLAIDLRGILQENN